jgi:hypothetical protein
MTKPLIPITAADDPRLKAIVGAAMRKAGLSGSWEHTVIDLATGQISRQSLRCCGSGCRPCVQDVQRCVTRVINAWDDPRFEAKLIESADGSIKGRARRMAKRAIRKLGG